MRETCAPNGQAGVRTHLLEQAMRVKELTHQVLLRPFQLLHLLERRLQRAAQLGDLLRLLLVLVH